MNPLHDPEHRGFASDNYAGVHPEVMEALSEANGGHQVAYGEDLYTQRLAEVIRAQFGEQALALPVFNGTGANVLSLTSILPRWGAVVCAESAHINVDENAAPERVGGFKLLTVPTPDGKLTPELVDRQAWGFSDVHRAQPLALSITQASELGTVYSPEEVKALTDHAHSLGMKVHMDGARLANAASSLGLTLKEASTDLGVDVLSLGGTKNGAMLAEACVILNPDAAQGTDFIRKYQMQLASKMRFISAQLIALYEGDLWSRNASHANAMASLLSEAVSDIPGVETLYRVQANEVFATVDPEAANIVRKTFPFYDWDEQNHVVRWVTSFDTTVEDVERFSNLLHQALA